MRTIKNNPGRYQKAELNKQLHRPGELSSLSSNSTLNSPKVTSSDKQFQAEGSAYLKAFQRGQAVLSRTLFRSLYHPGSTWRGPPVFHQLLLLHMFLKTKKKHQKSRFHDSDILPKQQSLICPEGVMTVQPLLHYILGAGRLCQEIAC